MASDTLVVVPGEFSIEDPWAIPAACEPVRLRRATDGTAPRLSTRVSGYYDNKYVTFVFSAADDHIVATMSKHDDPLYEEDVVEVFLAPDAPLEYFEIEVNPLGTTFDARIVSPAGTRQGLMAELGWNCDGLIAAVRKVIERGAAMSIDTVMRIPFASLRCRAPQGGEAWRGNFFRIDRHPREGDEYSAWRPTMKNPADFHVVSAFGQIVFDG